MREFLWRWRRTIALAATVAVAVTLLRLLLPQVVTKPLLIAATEIPPGTIINASQVRVKEIPIAALPPQAYQKPSQAVGQRTAVRIASGTVLFPALFSSSSFSRQTYKGQVIMALPLRESDQGLASAGDTVVFFLGNSPSLPADSSPPSQDRADDTTQIGCEYPDHKPADYQEICGQVTAKVLSVTETKGSLTGEQKTATIEVAVKPSEAGRLVEASKSEPLQLARTG